MTPPLHSDFLEQSKTRQYLLGISGGKDSVALLHTLLEYGYKNLILCHLNHGLRGKESEQDAVFVRQLAEKYKLPCVIQKYDVKKRIKEKGESMELAARNARRLFFILCAKEYGCLRILLAHHADDQAETVLFNLLRGSDGLKGMQFSSNHCIEGKSLIFIRPFLETSQSCILNYLIRHQISYREDASNAQPIAIRNRLRNEVIPLLSEIMQRDITQSINKSLSSSNLKNNALNKILTAQNIMDPQGRLYLPTLQPLPDALQLLAIKNYLQNYQIPKVTHNLLLRCQSLISEPTPSKINLPSGRYFRRKEKRLFISE